MPNTVQLKDKNGNAIFPVTDVSLIMGLQDAIKLPPVKTATLPTASAETAGKMYYVGPTNGEYERYITSAVEGSYEWIDLGNTAIPLPSIADNLTTDDANTALSAKQGKVLDGKVSQLGQEVDGVEQNYTSGKYIKSDGTIENSSSTFITDFIPVTNGDRVQTTDGYQYANTYAADKVTVLDTSNFNSARFVSQPTAAYIRFSGLLENLDTFRVEKNYQNIYAPQTGVEGIVQQLSNKADRSELNNKVDKTDFEALESEVVELKDAVFGSVQNWEAGYIKNDGAAQPSTSAGYCDYLPVNNGDIVVWAYGYQYICLYDSSKNLLNYWGAQTPTRTFTINNANAAYIRAGFLKDYFADGYISKNGIVVYKPQNDSDGLVVDVENIAEGVSGFGYDIDRLKETPDYVYNRIFDGADVRPEQGFILSPFIDIRAHRNIRIFPNGNRTLYFHIYDEDKDYLDYYSVAAGATSAKNLPSTAYYLRVCFENGTESGVYVKDNITEEALWTPFLYWKKALESGDVITLHPPKKMYAVLANLKNNINPMTGYPYGDTPLTLLFFSDLHACSTPLSRIMRFADEYNLKNYIDAVVAGGDNVNRATDNYAFWGNDGANRVLPVVGNHELLIPEDKVQAGTYQIPEIDGVPVSPNSMPYSAKFVYDREFAPFLAETQFTQIVTNKCYWYKDFPASKIRLIGLDDYHWKEAPIPLSNNTYSDVYPDGEPLDTGQQLAWFEGVLADSKTNGLSVVVVHHAPARFNNPIQCPFTSLDFQNNIATDPTSPTGAAYTKEPFVAVQNFIDGGGKFLCWLTGHLHQDAVGVIKGFTDQFQMTIDTTRYGYDSEGRSLAGGLGANMHIPNTESADCFDLVSVDTYGKTISLFRVGSDIDRKGRHIGCFVWDYENKTMISCD